MTFAEVVENLRRYDEAPVGAQGPAIFVAAAWAPLSDATIEWSGAKGGVHWETEAMCRKLAHHVTEMHAQRVRHGVEIEHTNAG